MSFEVIVKYSIEYDAITSTISCYDLHYYHGARNYDDSVDEEAISSSRSSSKSSSSSQSINQLVTLLAVLSYPLASSEQKTSISGMQAAACSLTPSDAS